MCAYQLVLALAVQLTYKPEVTEFDSVVRVDQYILGLDVQV